MSYKAPLLTVKMLNRANKCDSSLEKFEALYPKGVRLTLKNLRKWESERGVGTCCTNLLEFIANPGLHGSNCHTPDKLYKLIAKNGLKKKFTKD